MTALTSKQKALRNALIEQAAGRRPGNYAAAIKEGMRQFRALQEGIGEGVAPGTSTNRLNGPVSGNPMSDAGDNSFEAFLSAMIELIASKAAADGKVNPAYTQLAARLTAAQAVSMGGVQRSSFVSPAAGSTPVGRTESAPRAALAESSPEPVAPARDLADMSFTELQHEHMARLGLLRREGALRSPFYAPAA